MTDVETLLAKLVDQALAACQSWLVSDDQGGLKIVDPVDKASIPAHYGDSHLAAALLILGEMRANRELQNQGLGLTSTIIRDWDEAAKAPDFHFDFNNFALCLAEGQLQHFAPDKADEVRALLVSSADSNHNTVNWLPMRAYVNSCRYKWTNDETFNIKANDSLNLVESATNLDGSIEDRLPIGSSYNIQYNISSLAGLQYLETHEPRFYKNRKNNISFLEGLILPDHDINYLGRGTNQIFAWGPWIYSLTASNKHELLQDALIYLSNRYETSVTNQNLLLNIFDGKHKFFWWDYHYCSVYHAHLLLWLTLALQQLRKEATQTLSHKQETKPTHHRSNVQMHVYNKCGAVVFAGSRTYLAEAGPTLCALWSEKYGVLFKGGLGPWRGAFGKKYSYGDAVFQNYFGLISQGVIGRFENNRVYRRLNKKFAEPRNVTVKPLLIEPKILHKESGISIIYDTDGVEGYLNMPIFDHISESLQIRLAIDGVDADTFCVGKSINQYGWIKVIRSQATYGKYWEIHIT